MLFLIRLNTFLKVIMDVESVRNYCIKKKRVTESFPFDDKTLVFKVFDRMFCLLNLTPPQSINLKCDPVKAIELREEYEGVKPGYHMNKKHWNTISLLSNIPEDKIFEWINDSYDLVVSKLPGKMRKEL